MVKKRILIAGALVILASVLLAFWFISRDPMDRAEDYVLDHAPQLEAYAESLLEGQNPAPDFQGITVEGVFPGEQDIVQFRSSAWGLVPSSTYYGFYYAPQDQPAAYQNVDLPLTDAGEDTWEWTDGTDNGGVTRRIAPHWFTYEAWF